MRSALVAIAFLFVAAPATAEPTAPQPVVRTTIEPAQVVVGQPATLVVEVLAPNYMTAPPGMPDFQLPNAITRAGSTINTSDRQGDVDYAGIRYEFLIYPQEAGAYAVSGQTITVTFADNPPHTSKTEVAVPAANFEAVVPDAASGLDPFISATRLTLQQEIQHPAEPLKVGDAVTRIVTIEAEGAPAMLLPPTAFAPIAGTRMYRSEPELNDHFDQGSDVLSAVRTDRATYMLEAAGTITFQALEIAWWNATDHSVEHARTDPQSFTVTGGPPASRGASDQGGLSSPRRVVLFMLEHWLAVLSAIVTLAVLIWALPPIVRNLNSRVRHQREAYRQSEAFAFNELRRFAGRGDARLSYSALLLWLSRFAPTASSGTISSLTRWANDPILTQEIAALELQLFAAAPAPTTWSGGRLISAIGSARGKAGLRRRQWTATHSLPSDINPQSSIVRLRQLSRPVAR